MQKGFAFCTCKVWISHTCTQMEKLFHFVNGKNIPFCVASEHYSTYWKGRIPSVCRKSVLFRARKTSKEQFPIRFCYRGNCANELCTYISISFLSISSGTIPKVSEFAKNITTMAKRWGANCPCLHGFDVRFFPWIVSTHHQIEHLKSERRTAVVVFLSAGRPCLVAKTGI